MQISHRQNTLYKPLPEIHSAVVKALLYFDIFHYPLTLPEIVRFAGIRLFDLTEVESALEELEKELLVFRFGEFWALSNDFANIERRHIGNKHAAEIWNKAVRRSRFINKFPFVRSVNISGSLSKNYFDSEADFDFFIITHPNRLWICRTLLTAYKKIALFNSRKYFCINYFIDTDMLEIPDKNIYTATEIITLKNITGAKIFSDFMHANAWTTNFYPNFLPEHNYIESGIRKYFLKSIFEKLMNNFIGNWLDNACLAITIQYWKRKFKELSFIELETNLRSRKHVSKHHPQGFQFKVLVALEKKRHVFEQQHNVTL